LLSDIAAELELYKFQLGFAFSLNHPIDRVDGEPSPTEAAPPRDDSNLIQRIIAAYRLSSGTPSGSDGSIWQQFTEMNAEIHAALIEGDVEQVGQILRTPAKSMLLHGFDVTSQSANLMANPSYRRHIRWLVYDSLMSLAEATGCIRVENPEGHPAAGMGPDPENMLAALDGALRFRLEFHNVFDGDVGIKTSRGVATGRTIHSIYQAWRIASVVGTRGTARVLEIGAGLGRNAYYAQRLGLTDYTIIDLPLANVAQAYYLGTVLGADQVELYGESKTGPIKIKPPREFFCGEESYDLVFNADSITEMPKDTAQRYFRHARQTTNAVLSINHEANSFTFRDLYIEAGLNPVFRFPCWLRRGYVEEMLEFQGKILAKVA